MSGFNVIDVTDEKYCRSSETAESYHIVEDVTVLVSEVTDHDKVKVEMILDNDIPDADNNDEESGGEMIFSITS